MRSTQAFDRMDCGLAVVTSQPSHCDLLIDYALTCVLDRSPAVALGIFHNYRLHACHDPVADSVLNDCENDLDRKYRALLRLVSCCALSRLRKALAAAAGEYS